MRHRGLLLKAVSDADPENNPEFQRRDVTGDGVAETFCNLFVRRVLGLLGVTIPPMLANDLWWWFKTASGWRNVAPKAAMARAELGFPVVGVWRSIKGHGHVVLVVPAIGGTGMHCAQAGSRNWSNAPIEHSGLLANAYSFYTITE